MSANRASKLVSAMLHEIAPEIDAASADVDADLAEEFDLDSFAFLTLIELVHERTGIEVPETDYRLVSSVAGLVSYLEARGV